MPRIREHLFESPLLYSLTRGAVRVELSKAGADTARGADRGMLIFSVHALYDCGWVSVFECPTRFPSGDLRLEGRRTLRYLMAQFHESVSQGDRTKLRALAPRLHLMGPGNLLSSSGVAADDVLVAQERERQRQLRENREDPTPEAGGGEDETMARLLSSV